jgi:hypothetical protein
MAVGHHGRRPGVVLPAIITDTVRRVSLGLALLQDYEAFEVPPDVVAREARR